MPRAAQTKGKFDQKLAGWRMGVWCRVASQNIMW